MKKISTKQKLNCRYMLWYVFVEQSSRIDVHKNWTVYTTPTLTLFIATKKNLCYDKHFQTPVQHYLYQLKYFILIFNFPRCTNALDAFARSLVCRTATATTNFIMCAKLYNTKFCYFGHVYGSAYAYIIFEVRERVCMSVWKSIGMHGKVYSWSRIWN